MCNRVAFFFIMIVLGLCQGMQPIVGYNHGARNTRRVRSVLIKTIICATVVVCVGGLVGILFPRQLIRCFTSDSGLVELSVHYVYILFCTLPIIGFQIVVTNYFQRIGVMKKSIFLSLSRQLIFLIPAVLILPHFLGVDGVFWSIPVGDVAATFTTAVLLWIEMRRTREKVSL